MFNIGTGLICAQGRGAEVVRTADTVPPVEVAVPFQDHPFALYAVSPQLLKDRAVLGWMRRADRFAKMAMLAANDAFIAADISHVESERIGVILATALGPHATTFRFLDEILEYGDAAVSPTIFSNTVHNAALSYISKALTIKGPTLTLSCFENPFQRAVELAGAWLESGRCDYVLLGAGEECGVAMDYIYRERISGMVNKPGEPPVIPGEGFAFFVFTKQGEGPEFAITESSFSALCGHLFSGKALDCAIESLKNQNHLGA